MSDAGKMRDSCRICGRESCGNQRRWIFHPGAKPSSQVSSSHASGRESSRDGRGEFACSKCAFMSERMYRFDTVVARVEASSSERSQRSSSEKERSRHCIGGSYRRSNPGEAGGDKEDPRDAGYSDLIQEDLVFSEYESWADRDEPDQNLLLLQHQCPGAEQKQRRCRGCAALRVADSDYEAVCKVPRSVGRRSTSCGPSTRYSAAVLVPEESSRTSEVASDKRSHSPASSVESSEIHTNPEPEPEEASVPQRDSFVPGSETSSGGSRGWEYRPSKPPKGSKLPVSVRARVDPSIPEVVVLCPEQEELQEESSEESKEPWSDDYLRCAPFRFQQRSIGEQQDRLGRYESAAGECMGESQRAQNQVRSSQVKIRESETRNQKSQERLAEMESQSRSAQQEAQQQERNVQNSSDGISSKEAEVSESSASIEEQNQMSRSLREVANRSQSQQSQASGAEAAPGPSEVSASQASSFQAQSESQAGRRAQRRAARAQEDQNRASERSERDSQGASQHRRETERHNQESQSASQAARSASQEKEESSRDGERERRSEKEQSERTAGESRTSSQAKEQSSQEYGGMLKEPTDDRDSVLQKLRQRITERDRASERAVDEKFLSREEKEEESRRLQSSLREKERDSERQRCVSANNEETIASSEASSRGKASESEQVSDTWRGVRQRQQDDEERQKLLSRERDRIIDQSQGASLACTQEAQESRGASFPQIHSAPGQVSEELKVRLQLKDRLFQEVMSDRTRQVREHDEQVQDSLRTISSRDQYIQDAAGRLTEVSNEQTSRVQESRRQSNSKPDAAPEQALEVQALQDESRSVLAREKENQEEGRIRAGRSESSSRMSKAKEEIIGESQRQAVAPSDLPSVERLTQELQSSREVSVQQEAPQCGESSCEDEDEVEEESKSQFSAEDEDESGSKAPRSDGEGSMEVKQSVEHKRVSERESGESKGQSEKAGFSSSSQMRRASFGSQGENDDSKLQSADRKEAEEEEEESDVTVEEEEESSGMWEAWDGESSPSDDRTQKTGSSQEEEPSNRSQDVSSSAAHVQSKSRESQERSMVSEATVQAQAEQLKDYRELSTETAVQQDSKQVQVDSQDSGYETCGRSENEAEREEASSPEFDDSEMCTSSDCGSQWWPTSSSSKAATPTSGYGDDVSSLQRSVEDLRSQLSRSQGVIRGSKSRLRCLSTSSDSESSASRKVNRSSQASHSGAEDDEGWQSSQRHQDKDLQELTSRVDALEDQSRKGGKKNEDGDSANWPGKFDSSIKAQARESSHLRQRLRDGRGVCGLLIQHSGDTTKAFEESSRASDVDYYMGQSFREQSAQSGASAQRISARIGGRDPPEDPDERTESLAIRLSKELQQKDKVIESLRAKSDQHHHHHHQRSDTPTSSHALSDVTDQSDRISYVSDERGSTNEDSELCCDADAGSGLGPEEAQNSAGIGTDCSHGASSRHPSVPSSISSSHRTQSCPSCPSMHLSSSPHRPADSQSHSGFSTPQSRSLHGFPLAHQRPADPSASSPLSYRGLQPSSPFGGSSSDAGMATKAAAGSSEGSALWEVPYGGRATGVGADSSSGSSGYQSGTSHAGSDSMKEHSREIRSSRQRSEDSIQTNDRLRQQSEEKSDRAAVEKGAPTNIYIQGSDSVGQLSRELRSSKEENSSSQTQSQSASRDGGREAERSREAVLSERSRLKEAESETQRWAELGKRSQAEDAARCQEVAQSREERQRSQGTINRSQHEASVSQSQSDESRSSVQSSEKESQQAERTNGLTDKVPSPPVRDGRLISPPSPSRPGQRRTTDPTAPEDSPFSRHADASQQQLLEGTSLVVQMEAALCSSNASSRLHQPFERECVQNSSSDTRTMKRVSQEAESSSQASRRSDPCDSEETKQDESSRSEVVSSRSKLSEQEQALKDAMERSKSSSLSKDSMEHFIINQLSRTRDVSKKAKTNSEENKLRISILHQASVSAPPPSLPPFSHPQPIKGESFGELASSADRRVSTPSSSSSSASAWRVAARQRPSQAVCS